MKCGSRRFYVIEKASVPHYEFSNSVKPFAIAAAYVEVGKPGFFGAKSERLSVGVEVQVCAKCRHIEFYASDLDVLKMFAESGEASVREVKR